MEKTLAVINSLESAEVIGRYAIGGAVALLFYAEPAATYDLDIFCHLPQSGTLIDLQPIYDFLAKKGYLAVAEHVLIEGIPVQFLPPTTELVKEALDRALATSFANTPTRVIAYEYLLAIMVETGRAKDKARILGALEQTKPDQSKLDDILKRHNLSNKWSNIIA